MAMSNCINTCSGLQLLTVIHYLAVQCPFLSCSIIIQKQVAMKVSHLKDYLHQKNRNWREARKSRNLKPRRLRRKAEKVCPQNVTVLYLLSFAFFCAATEILVHSSSTEVIVLFELLIFLKILNCTSVLPILRLICEDVYLINQSKILKMHLL